MTIQRRVFSGIQPTGKLHLGNYLGAISLWVDLQGQYETIVCIADLHALTTPESVRHANLQAKVRETAAALLACGIDPVRAILFVQSRVGAHAELAWLLSCVTPVSWLERMIQFKTRAATLESVGTGLWPTLSCKRRTFYYFAPTSSPSAKISGNTSSSPGTSRVGSTRCSKRSLRFRKPWFSQPAPGSWASTIRP